MSSSFLRYGKNFFLCLTKKIKITMVLFIVFITIFIIELKCEKYYIIEKGNALPDLELFNKLNFKSKKYILLTFFFDYCEACKEGIRREILNKIANKYYNEIEVVGIFKDFSELDLDNLKYIYQFSFKLYSTKLDFIFKEKKSHPFKAHPFSILVNKARKVIFMENVGSNFETDLENFLLKVIKK